MLALATVISVGNVPLPSFAIVTALSAILAVVTESLARSPATIVPSSILALVIAPSLRSCVCIV